MLEATQLRVGTRPQLLVDNWLIEQTDGVQRKWYKPERLRDDPVLVADRPWEHTPYFTYSNYNQFQDPHDGLIKCWYEDLGPLQPHQRHPWQSRMLLATSSDGVTFEKPALGVVSIDGQDTNIFMGYAAEGENSPANPWSGFGVHSAAIVSDR